MNNKLKALWGAFAVSAVSIASYVSNAPLLVFLGSLVGIIFVVSVAFQHKYANFWGALCGLSFGYFSYQQGLYGNALIQLGFVVPMSIYGLWVWTYRSSTRKGLKRSLTASEGKAILGMASIGLTFAMLFSFLTGATMAPIDALTTVLPVVGTFLLVNAYAQQWYAWIAYNIIEVGMWFVVSSTAPEMLAILVMRIVFFLNSLIGYYEWRK